MRPRRKKELEAPVAAKQLEPQGAKQYKPGDVYDGPLCWTTDPVIGRPGFYALAEPIFDDPPHNTKIASHPILDPPLMLTWVDNDPTNEEDMDGVYVVANPEGPYYAQHPPHQDKPRAVELQAHAKTTSRVSA